MRLVGFAVFAAAILAVSPADAQQTIKIGLILPYSGQFRRSRCPGRQRHQALHAAARRYGRRQENRDRAQGYRRHRARRAKRLAQELVVRDKVDLLAGFSLTPNALAAADVSAQAKKFMVVMNAAASIVTTKSPYMARVSFTLPQLNEPLGVWAYKNGVRKVYSIVADFAAGHDAEAAFQSAFKAAGGEIIGSVRYPVVNPTSPPSCSAPRT
jgi:branched-chain amino acid transport system substrate-binding protein